MKTPNWAVGLEVTHAAADRLRFQYTSGDLMIPRPPGRPCAVVSLRRSTHRTTSTSSSR